MEVDLRPAVSEFIDVLRQWKHMEDSDASKLVFRVRCEMLIPPRCSQIIVP